MRGLRGGVCGILRVRGTWVRFLEVRGMGACLIFYKGLGKPV